MDWERLRNFKELQAKFQKLDAPSLPGPTGISQKGDPVSTQSSRIVANGRPLSSKHSQPSPSCSSGEPQPLELQKMKLAQRSEIQTSSNSPGPPDWSVGSAVHSQTASLLLDMCQSNDEMTNRKKVGVASSFRDKLWNWEKVSSQQSEMSSDYHLEVQKSTGLTLKEPWKKLEMQGAPTLPSQRHLMVQRKSCATSEDPAFLLSQHERKSLEHPRPERSLVASTCQPVYESEFTSQPPATPPDVKHQQLPKRKPLPSLESLGHPPTKPPKPPAVNLQAFQRRTGKTCREAAEEASLPPESAEFEEPRNYEAIISYLKHSGNSINLCTSKEIADCGYADTLEVTKETPDQGTFKPSSISEVYDDVEYPGREESKSDFSNSFPSDHGENSEEMYEDVYRTKSNYEQIDLDGKEGLTRLQRFFKKEKDRFKMKKTKSKGKLSAFSISLPNLELRSQEVIVHADVCIHGKESKDEDKVKTWKPKFLITKGKQEKKGAEESENLSPRNVFRTKKQILEKKRMEREKLFRERFEYDKEITVINTAVACSSKSRNGIFDLPVTPGEELEVIDVTEGNLVICRNSKGKYGYVLIEHLNFKHQGWSP